MAASEVHQPEFVEPESGPDLVKRRSATDLARVWQEQKERIERAFAEIADAQHVLGLHFSSDPTDLEPGQHDFHIRVKVDHRLDFSKPEPSLLDLRHRVWDRIIDLSGVRQLLSIDEAKKLDGLIRNRELPEITPDSVRDLANSYRSQIGELHAAAVREVFEMLRPRWSRYKTNTEFELGEKVILSGWVRLLVGRNHFDLNYDHHAEATALENVFRALDGQGQVAKSHFPDLYHAIEKAGPEGIGETSLFAFKCFANGNLHLKFKRADLVTALNRVAGGHRLKEGGK